MASASTTWTSWLLSAGVRQRPSKTGAVVTQFVTQTGDDHVQRATRIQENCRVHVGPRTPPEQGGRRVKAARRPRPSRLSTTVVCRALADGLFVPKDRSRTCELHLLVCDVALTVRLISVEVRVVGDDRHSDCPH